MLYNDALAESPNYNNSLKIVFALVFLFIPLFIMLYNFPSISMLASVCLYVVFASMINPVSGIALWVLFLPYENYYLGALSFSPFIGLTTALAFGYFLNLIMQKSSPNIKKELLVISFSFIILAQLTWLFNPYPEMYRHLVSLAISLLIFLIISTVIQTRAYSFWVLSIIIIVASMISISTVEISGWRIDMGGNVRALSNVFGLSLIFLTSGLLFKQYEVLLPYNKTRSIASLSSISLIFVIAVFLLLTVSRGVILALLLSVAVMLYYGFKWARFKISLNYRNLIIFLVTLGLTTYIGLNYLGRTSEQLIRRISQNPFENVRFQIWESVFNSLNGLEWLFGAGLGSFRQLSAGYYAHSIFIDTLVSLGFIGLSVLLIFLFLIYRRMVKSKNILGLGLITYLIISFATHGSLANKYFWVIFAICHGLTYHSYKGAEIKSHEKTVSGWINNPGWHNQQRKTGKANTAPS